MATAIYKFQGFSTKTNQFYPQRLYDIELAKQDLLNEIYTRKGERVMEPEFGSIVWELLFDPIGEQAQQDIKADMIKIVRRDPRWNLEEVQSNQTTDQSSITVQLDLTYVPTTTPVQLLAKFEQIKIVEHCYLFNMSIVASQEI